MNDDRIKGQLDDRTLQTRKMLTKLVMAMLMTVVRTYVRNGNDGECDDDYDLRMIRNDADCDGGSG